ncbi:MAG: macro domain-containing protein [Candidatus Woykebacteria bacterium]
MKLVLGDITQIPSDAIVNAANTQLQHGGGVAAAVVRAGGEIIQKESDQIGWCDIGKAAVTGAGKLPAKCVIHVPTIDYKSDKKANLEDIKKGVIAALEIAKNTKCKKVTFPLLGAGVVGLAAEDVAKTMKEAVESAPKTESILVVRSQEDFDKLKGLLND